MKYIGAHVSTQGGIANAPLQAKKIGAKAFAFFPKNQRRWTSPAYKPEDIVAFKSNLKQSKIAAKHILAHSSYLINLGHPKTQQRKLSIDALLDEAHRCEQLGVNLLAVHPGNHLRELTEAECLDHIANSINKVLTATKDITIVIENTAGQGSSLGYTFAHLAYLIAKIKNKKRVGVCIDTCHLFAAGYDFRNQEKYNLVWQQFAKTVGFAYLKGLHLNDSKKDLGSKLDRHDSIGEGKLGLEPFKLLMQDPRFDNMPLILETINPEIWPQEIKQLYNFTEL